MSQVFGYINENEDVPFTFDKAFPYEYPCGNDVMNCDGKHVLDIDVMNGDGDDDDGGGKADKQVLDIDAMNGDSDDNDGGGKADKQVLDIDENPKDEAPWDDEGVSPKKRYRSAATRMSSKSVGLKILERVSKKGMQSITSFFTKNKND